MPRTNNLDDKILLVMLVSVFVTLVATSYISMCIDFDLVGFELVNSGETTMRRGCCRTFPVDLCSSST